MPATPVLPMAMALRGLPISCFLNSVSDFASKTSSMSGMRMSAGSNGGGIGTYWGSVRSIARKGGSERVDLRIIPFIPRDGQPDAGDQPRSLRRGSPPSISTSPPQIEEFSRSGSRRGDINRKSLNLHHGINITDEFMIVVRTAKPFGLRRKNGSDSVKHDAPACSGPRSSNCACKPASPTSSSRHGEQPDAEPPEEAGPESPPPNLCSEIVMLHTGMDHKGCERTAVCCPPPERREIPRMENHEGFWKTYRFLITLQDFIDRAPEEMERAGMPTASGPWALADGFPPFPRAMNVSMESAMAKSGTTEMFRTSAAADAASASSWRKNAARPDAAENIMARLRIAGDRADSLDLDHLWRRVAGIEPILANIYTHKTPSGCSR